MDFCLFPPFLNKVLYSIMTLLWQMEGGFTYKPSKNGSSLLCTNPIRISHVNLEIQHIKLMRNPILDLMRKKIFLAPRLVLFLCFYCYVFNFH